MDKVKRLNLIGYCRTSTENQKEEGTINHQVEDLKSYADKNNIRLIETFKDDGVSGSLEWHDRKGMSEMFNYIEVNQNVDGIIIYKLDRLARDLRIQENIIYDLQERKGKQIISIKEPDLDSKDITRVLFRQMLSAVAQYEKGLITMRMMNGRIKKAEKGGYAGGSPAYGYVSKDKKLLVNKSQAEVVRFIFQLRRKMSLREIVKELNRLNIKTARGGKWHAGTVRYIINNRIYKGKTKYKGINNKNIELNVFAI